MATDEKRAALHPDDQEDDTPAQDQRQQRAHQGQDQHDQQPAQQPTDEEQPTDQLLHREILEALQPVLTEFQQRMAQVVQQQMDEALHLDGQGDHDTWSEAGENSLGVAQRPEARSAALAPAAGQISEVESVRSVPATDQTGSSGLLHSILEMLKQETEQSLRTLLDIALEALFSDSVRRSIQRQTEQALPSLLQVSLAAVPNAAARRELQEQAEATLRIMLQESLDAIFATEVRTEVQTHLQAALDALLQGNVEVARLQVEQLVNMFIRRVLPVIQRYAERVPRLLLRALLSLLQDAAGATEKKDAPHALPPAPGQAGG